MSNPRVLAYCSPIDLSPKAPFNFDATFHKPDHFPSADNTWQPGVRWQTLRWQGERLGLKFENRGTIEAPLIRLSVFSETALEPAFLADLAQEMSYRCNLQQDLADFNGCFAEDGALSPLIERWRGMRLMNMGCLYEYLIIAIVLQNTVVRRSISMLQTLFEQFGERLDFDGQSLYCFWLPEEMAQVSEQRLRDLKMGYRARSIVRVSQALADRQVDEMALRSQPREMQRTALLSLYGIGPASVWYILTDVFHHLDELNHISPWEQKIYSRVFFGTPVEEPVAVESLVDYFNQHFGQYKMLAVHYFWEDLWWQHQQQPVEWLAPLIRR
jgi:3-methyladenine DNA glycosylase/8-oxoguanine DNA glycosylase